MSIQQFLLPLLCAGLLMPGAAGGAGLPLQLHPDNPHYFLWRGQPTVLITSGEHYGAVLNADFDYVKYPGHAGRRQTQPHPHLDRRHLL